MKDAGSINSDVSCLPWKSCLHLIRSKRYNKHNQSSQVKKKYLFRKKELLMKRYVKLSVKTEVVESAS